MRKLFANDSVFNFIGAMHNRPDDGSGGHNRTFSADGLGGGVTSGKLDGKVFSANNGIGTGAIKPSDVVDRTGKLDANSGRTTDTGIKGHDASGIAKKKGSITGDTDLGTTSA